MRELRRKERPTGLDAEALCRLCDAAELPFETTAELDSLTEVAGQERAVDAIGFAMGVRREGYNVFVLGPTGTGKHLVARRLLRRRAAAEAVPPDWCYVFNFDRPHKPRALTLPAGEGRRLEQAMKKLVDDLNAVIPAVFESDDYRNRRSALEEAMKTRQKEAFASVQKVAQERNLAIMQTESGVAIAPMRDGKAIPPEEFNALPEAVRAAIQENIAHVEALFGEIMRNVPGWVREARTDLEELNREVSQLAVKAVIKDLRAQFAEREQVLAYLDSVEADMVDKVALFREQRDHAPHVPGQPMPLPGHGGNDHLTLRRYGVNVLTDHTQASGAPVVYADRPSYRELFGSIEHIAQFGTLVTDFMRIKGGALHRANGGYLILDARKVLMEPFVWEGLKHALRSREIRLEPPQAFGVISTQSLSPKPLPLNVKVVLIGDRRLYYLLDQADPDFAELFKVTADFDDHMPRTPDNNLLYARLFSTMGRKENLRPLTREAMARLLEHSSRLSGDGERLSTNVRLLSDLVREADHYAGEVGHEHVEHADLQRAIDAAVERVSRLRHEMRDQIVRGTVLIDTDGEAVGQINGLSVLQLGRYAFGKPSRITARLRLGAGRVIDIEREVELGGPLHSKGVMILTSYLGSQYASDRPLSLSASLVFEQSYGGVDGDSASSTELYALLSALARVPIRQGLAVTGAVNQYGRVQAIGGVNEKIEGFFDLCAERGLTGDQGVLIPASNVKHLMLRRDVVNAVSERRFHVYPVTTIDEGIEILTGVEAGERDDDGHYPTGTINHLVETRLIALADKRRAFAAREGDGGKDD